MFQKVFTFQISEVLLGPLWRNFRVVWGSIGDPLGPSWDPVGPSRDPLRPSLVYLEGLLGVSWHSLGVFWSLKAVQRIVQGVSSVDCSSIVDDFGVIFDNMFEKF